MGLLISPRRITPSALGVLSRNAPCITCFTDGSASVPASNGGIGLVLKFGYYTVEIGRPVSGRVSSDMTELLAVEAAIDLFPPERKLIINSDSKTVINLLSKNHKSKAKKPSFPKAISRVKEKLKNRTVKLNFVDRKARAGTAHSRADRLASKSRKENKGIFRIISI